MIDKMVLCSAHTGRILLAFILGVGLGVWFQYLNVLFWKRRAKKEINSNL